MKILRIFTFLIAFALSSAAFGTTLSKDTTYYSDAFEGGSTSNGEIFTQSGFTAATCDIPLGKSIYVFSTGTGTVVRVNDRPNCTRYPNILDLTKKVFSLFAPVSAGRVSGIQVDTLDSLNSFLFRSLGIQLDADTPTVYFAGDGVEFSGKVLNGKSNVIVFLQNEDTKEELTKLFSVESGKIFRARLTLPKTPGKYSLVIASGNSFETRNIGYITLISRDTFYTSDVLPETNVRLFPRVEQIDGIPSIALASGLWGNLEMNQDTKTYQTSGTRFLFDSLPQYRTGKATVKIEGYTTSSGGSLDRTASIASLFSGTVLLDRTHEKE